MKFRDRFFKNRVKPIVIALMILSIPLFIFLFLSFTSYPVNFFYEGIAQSIFSIFMLLMGIEQILLSKKRMSIVFFIITVLLISVAVESFYVSQLHN
ncbi:hypothetical protein CN946_22745 [Bacillus sp. AFS053548]|nr:hypothetical protein CN946_22745 [Bacillus sp. AFS053548]